MNYGAKSGELQVFVLRANEISLGDRLHCLTLKPTAYVITSTHEMIKQTTEQLRV